MTNKIKVGIIGGGQLGMMLAKASSKINIIPLVYSNTKDAPAANVREMMRKKNNFTNIKLLVEELDSYAADINYIKTINLIIDVNKLDQFDAFIYSTNNCTCSSLRLALIKSC